MESIRERNPYKRKKPLQEKEIEKRFSIDRRLDNDYPFVFYDTIKEMNSFSVIVQSLFYGKNLGDYVEKRSGATIIHHSWVHKNTSK